MNWTGILHLLAGIYLFYITYAVDLRQNNIFSKLLYRVLPLVLGMLLFLYGLGVMGIISFKGVV